MYRVVNKQNRNKATFPFFIFLSNQKTSVYLCRSDLLHDLSSSFLEEAYWIRLAFPQKLKYRKREDCFLGNATMFTGPEYEPYIPSQRKDEFLRGYCSSLNVWAIVHSGHSFFFLVHSTDHFYKGNNGT